MPSDKNHSDLSPAFPSIQLKCLLLNAENLFLLSDQKLTAEHLKLDPIQWAKLSTSIYENKPLEKLIALQKLMEEINPDIIFLVEVGGSESLQNFNRLFLKDQYSPALIEGNSNRNIDVGFLIRKNLGFYFDIITNKNRSINYLYPHEQKALDAGFALKNLKNSTSHRFSRDAAELHLFQHDREKPFCLFVLSHLKSRLDPEGIDPNGFERRRAELRTLIEIYHELEKKHAGTVPIALLGDFNGNATPRNTDPEFKPIYESTELRDVCDLAGLDEKSSATFVQVNRNSSPEGKQLDYCFLSKAMQNYIDKSSVQVYRYRGPLGMSLDIPTRLEEKLSLPSDHYPVLFTLKGLPLR